jgi:soluble lytic murein transglycosylase-like protein
MAGVAKAHPGKHCHTRACPERVAMKQCSQARPVHCIRRAAIRHRVAFHLQLAIARCESRLRPEVTNTSGSGASGLMQFMPSTFAATPYRFRWIFSAKWNALAGAWLLQQQGTGPWTASRGCWG